MTHPSVAGILLQELAKLVKENVARGLALKHTHRLRLKAMAPPGSLLPVVTHRGLVLVVEQQLEDLNLQLLHHCE